MNQFLFNVLKLNLNYLNSDSHKIDFSSIVFCTLFVQLILDTEQKRGEASGFTMIFCFTPTDIKWIKIVDKNGYLKSLV